MRRFIILLTIALLIGLGCMPKLTRHHKSDECQAYYQLLRTQWVKYEGYYLLKKNPPYLEDSLTQFTYFNRGCVIGLHEKRIAKMIGQPNKIRKIPPGFELIYCMNQNCSRQWKIYTDSTGVIYEFWLHPVEISRD